MIIQGGKQLYLHLEKNRIENVCHRDYETFMFKCAIKHMTVRHKSVKRINISFMIIKRSRGND